MQKAAPVESWVRPSDSLWQQGSGYYRQNADALRRTPLLPDLKRLRVQRIANVFELAGLRPGTQALEIGCGCSQWLPFLATHFRCAVAGIELEPFAAELARANLEGAGVNGRVFCRDAFDTQANADLEAQFDLVFSMGVLEHFGRPVAQLDALASYVKPGGFLLTTVPNLRGLNGMLQKLVDRERLEMHVTYDTAGLVSAHEQAGFSTLSAGYVGFYEGYLTAPGGNAPALRKAVHSRLCKGLSLCAEAWTRLVPQQLTPELPWLAPHIFYIGQRTAATQR